ncbi:MAG: hypothetical protein L6Q66_11760 [Bacteroidia bacterium]|nr:hypothetical protein [Bacteroidia bacterium]
MLKNLVYLTILTCLNYNNAQSQVELSNNTQSTNNNSSLYWSGTAAFSAVNITATYLNIRKLNKEDRFRSNAIFGVISGCAQTAFGVAFVNSKFKNSYIPISINIGVGLTTVATSVLRLAKKNPSKQNNTSLNLMYLPGNHNSTAFVGFTFKKNL